MKISAREYLPILKRDPDRILSTANPLWHPLGFVSCVIAEVPKRSVTRIHYWPLYERHPKKPDWPIHTHVYDISSVILLGRVLDLQYVRSAGNEFTEYEVSYSGENSVIVPTGRVTSVEQSVNAFRIRGDEYTVSSGVYHQTLVAQTEEAVTLVTFSNFVAGNPLVLGSAGENSFPYFRTKFDKNAFADKVHRALSAFSI